MGKNCNNTGKFKKIQQPLHYHNENHGIMYDGINI